MTKTSSESLLTAGRVYANAYFCVEPCVTCFVPGYLIVTPQLPTVSLSELERDALASLGPTLATRSVHFHLFPWTAWLLSEYAAVHPADREVSGPRLLDWARRTFHRPISTDYTETIQAIFRELDRSA